MNTLTAISGSSEPFQETFDHTVQEVVEDLKRPLRIIVSSIDVYFTTHNLYTTGIHWGGYIDLQVFVENLPTLEKEAPYVYSYLTDNHKEVIEKAKRLLVKLKLQNLPIPQVIVTEDNSNHYPKKSSKRYIQIGDDTTVWQHFYDTCPGKNAIEVGNQAKEYLEEVKPVLLDICEIIASTAYEHLMSVSKSIRAEYL